MVKPRSNKEIEVNFKVKVNEAAYNILKEYDYYFERNIKELIETHASFLVDSIMENIQDEEWM